MKELTILFLTVFLLTACDKPKRIDNTITAAEPMGFIDSLSHKECNELPKPLKHD